MSASDARGDAIAFSIDNAKAAGIGHLLRFTKKDIRDLEWPAGEEGVIVCNPPYGERIGEERELVGLYRLLGETIRSRPAGWRLWVFTGNERLAGEVGVEPFEQVALFNGAIPCRLLGFAPGGMSRDR